jgi:hypothetical protein
MSSMLERSRRPLALFAALGALAVYGCGDGTDPEEPEPEVATIRVSIGTFSLDVPHPIPCDGSNTPVPLIVNQTNQVSFRLLGADGADEPIIVAERENLELDMTNLAATWTVTPTGGSAATFTANITSTATGSFIPRLEILNTEHDHNEVECIIRFNVAQ